MQEYFTAKPGSDVRTIHVLGKEEFDEWRSQAPDRTVRWMKDNDFSARAGSFLGVPGADGQLESVIAGVGANGTGVRDMAALAQRLPAGTYRLHSKQTLDADLCALGWAQGQYRFSLYRQATPGKPRILVWPEGAARDDVIAAAQADKLVRDLVNTPASDMGPNDLEAASRDLATEFGAKCAVTAGDDLLADNYPSIHAVGRASSKAPRLIDLRWGEAGRPRVTLVGKGVCFDSGGLNIKPAAGMRWMKKDMGGAAHVMGLARMIMASGLPVTLRVLVAAVENSISDNAYRPGDVLPTRKGITVEIGNTDAEGRIVLSDALALADEESPDLIVNMATLTGAARIALGPELPAMYTDNDEIAVRLQELSCSKQDPLWRMPLWSPYDRDMVSGVADVNHIASNSLGGSIHAALFLRRFVENAGAFVHMDIYSWNSKTRPGRPEGAETQGIRSLFALISERYGT
ncbi:MAG: leucyl aminopeptidase family protein [Gammaproteobacteria bacterium]